MQHLYIKVKNENNMQIDSNKIEINGWKSEKIVRDKLDLQLSANLSLKNRKNSLGIINHNNDGFFISLGHPLNVNFENLKNSNNIFECFKNSSGVFAFVYYEFQNKILHIITDFLGNCPIYLSKDRSGIEISTLTRSFKYTPDPKGWSGFVFSGHVIGSGTLLHNVERIPGAQHWKIYTDDLRIEKQTYWHPPFNYGQTNLADLVDAFEENIRLNAESVENTSILLSGGIDSRIILGCSTNVGIKPFAHIVNHSEEAADADGVFAEAVARAGGVNLQRHEPERNFSSSSNYLRYIEAIEGAFPTYGLFIGKVLSFVPRGGVLEGQLPNVTLRPVFPVGGFSAYDQMRFEKAGSKKFEAARRLFTPEFFGNMLDGFSQAVNESRRSLPDNDCGISHWITTNRMQRRAGYNSYKAYETRATTLAAGAAPDFWKLAMQMPRHEKADYKLCWQILETRFPKLASIPIVSGGTLTAAPSGQRALKLWKARSSFNSFARQHPRLGRLFGWKRLQDQPSSFLTSPALFEPEPALQPQTLDALRLRPQSDPDAMRLLFHWKTTAFHHAGTLYSAFERDSANGVYAKYVS
jgi:hypothetical protein